MRLFAWLGERAPDDRDEFIEVERFRQVFVGPAFGRGDGRHERILRAHNDNRQVGSEFLDARDKVEGAFVGHDDVGDDEVALPLADPTPERCGIARRPGRITGTREGLIEDGADGRVVVSDEYIAFAHVCLRLSPPCLRRPLALVLGHRHERAKNRVAGTRVALDDSAMVVDDLGDERQT